MLINIWLTLIKVDGHGQMMSLNVNQLLLIIDQR